MSYRMFQNNEKLARNFFKVGLRVAANVLDNMSEYIRKQYPFPQKPSLVDIMSILSNSMYREYNAMKDPAWPASEAYKDE